MIRTIYITIVLIGALAAVSHAQHRSLRDTVIKDQTIEIVQEYEPEVRLPEKEKLVPELPLVEKHREIFQYEVPQQLLSYSYTSIPIRPLSLGLKTPEDPYNSYLKLGLGNRSSVLVDVGLANLKGDDYQVLLHGNHLSQKGSLENQQFSNTAIDLSGTYKTAGHTLGGALRYHRNGLRYYGYDQDSFTYENSAVKQVFNYIGAEVFVEKKEERIGDVGYRPQLNFYTYHDNFKNQENNINGLVPMSFFIHDRFKFHLQLSGNWNFLNFDTAKYVNSIVQALGGFSYTGTKGNIFVGIAPTWGANWTAYLLPDIRFSAHFLKNGLTLKAGWKGNLLQQSYWQLTQENPFIYAGYTPRQSKTDKIYGAFEAALGSHVSFGATLSWNQWRNHAMMVNNYGLSRDGKQFGVVFDEQIQALNMDAFIRYQVSETFLLGVNGSWYNFLNTTTFDKVWHTPMLKIGANMQWSPVRQLQLAAGANFWDGMYARLADGTAKAMEPFLDVNFSGEYQIIPKFSIYLQLNNILNTTYQRWNQYPNYGWNLIGGIRFKFK